MHGACSVKPLSLFISTGTNDFQPHKITEVCEMQNHSILEASLKQFPHLQLCCAIKYKRDRQRAYNLKLREVRVIIAFVEKLYYIF